MRKMFLVILALCVLLVVLLLGVVTLFSSSVVTTNNDLAAQNTTDTLSPFYLTRGVEQTASYKTAVVHKTAVATEVRKDMTIKANQQLNGINGLPAINVNLTNAMDNKEFQKVEFLTEDYALSHLPANTDLSKPVQLLNSQCGPTSDINVYLKGISSVLSYPDEGQCEVAITGTFTIYQTTNTTKIVHTLLTFFAEDTGNLLIEIIRKDSDLTPVFLETPQPIIDTATSAIKPYITPAIGVNAAEVPTFTADDIKKYFSNSQVLDTSSYQLPPDKTKVDKIELMTTQAYVAKYGTDKVNGFIDPPNRLIYVVLLDTEYFPRVLQGLPPVTWHHVYFVLDAHTGELLTNYFEP